MPSDKTPYDVVRLFRALFEHPGDCLARACLKSAYLAEVPPGRMVAEALLGEGAGKLAPVRGLERLGVAGGSAAFIGFEVPAGSPLLVADGVQYVVDRAMKAAHRAGATAGNAAGSELSDDERLVCDLVLQRCDLGEPALAQRLANAPDDVRYWVLSGLAARRSTVAALYLFFVARTDERLALDLLLGMPVPALQEMWDKLSGPLSLEAVERSPLLVALFGVRALPLLTAALGSPLRRTRSGAVTGLVKLGEAAVPVLLHVIETGVEGSHARAVVEVAVALADRRLFPFARAHLHDADVRMRSLALLALARADGDAAEASVIDALQDRAAEVVRLAIALLTQPRSEAAVDALTKMLDQPAFAKHARESLEKIALGGGPHALQAQAELPPPAHVVGVLGDGRGMDAFCAPPAETLEAPKVPPPADACYFSVRAPMGIRLGETALLEVWCHQVPPEVFLASLAPASNRPQGSRSAGPFEVGGGATLDVKIRLEACDIEEPSAQMRWRGGSSVANFVARPRAGSSPGLCLGTVDIELEQVRLARIRFQVELGESNAQIRDCTTDVERLRTAFASYATEDRDRVLARLQGMQAALPDLDIFMDVISLRAGDDWQSRLVEEIAARDRFFLFWSLAASRSEWVEFEWRSALKARGLDYIAPVRLDKTEVAPPPKDLAGKHFGDWTRAL